MSFTLNVSEDEIAEKKRYPNAKGNTECVEFIRQTTSAPGTQFWRPGIKVLRAPFGTIARGTAIATFDEKDRYPTDAKGKHAAIYLYQTAQGIVVLDQWNSLGKVSTRTIRSNPKASSRSNNADTYYVIE